MHCCSVFLMAIYLAITRSLQAAPSQTRSISNTQILVNVLIAPRVVNATEQMKKLYAFITSTYHLEDTPVSLGLDLNADCFRLQGDGKLDAVYKQMAVFAKPLYLAYSYEHSQSGAQHAQLALILEMTSNFLNDTVSYTKHQILIKGLTPPNYPEIPEAKLDERTRIFLNALVQGGIVTLTVTDDVIKRYRNYVILYVLRDVIIDLEPCIASV